MHADAPVPEYHSRSARKRLASHHSGAVPTAIKAPGPGRAVYDLLRQPQPARICEDLIAVFEHNGIRAALAERTLLRHAQAGAGRPGAVAAAKDVNVPDWRGWCDEGWDIVAPVPSCALMFKQELPLLFPDDEDVALVARRSSTPSSTCCCGTRATR